MIEPVLCVDFGTSHTLAGVAYPDSEKKNQKIKLEPKLADPYLMRTLLYFPTMNECYYGSQALEKFIENEMEGRIFRSFKAHLPNKNYLGSIIDNRILNLETMIGTFLLEIKKRSELQVGHQLTKIILGKPARYSMDVIEDEFALFRMTKAAQFAGFIDIEFIPVDTFGCVDLTTLKKFIRPSTKLVSLMWVNNEIGSVNPIHELATYCQEQKIYFHTDATQAVGKIEVDLQKTSVHFLTFSAHKFYGPKGVGCLIIKSNSPHIQIEPLLFGGGQQNNHRSGTMNVPAIVGTGKAAEIALEISRSEAYRTGALCKDLFGKIKEMVPAVSLNGPEFSNRSPINLSITFDKPIDLVLAQLSSLAFSQGSACSTAGITSSHVLKAIGLTQAQTQNTLRLSVGRWTTQADIQQAAEILIKVFKTS